MAKKSNKLAPTEAQVSKFELLLPMLESALYEMRGFAKKKQDGVLSPMKVKMINRILGDIKEQVLKDEVSVEYLNLLDDETLPQNSDAVLVLGRFKAAMDAFRSANYRYDRHVSESRWFTKENP